MAEKKNARTIKYLNMGFEDFVKDLQNFKKVFFPESAKSFHPASSGQSMIEESAFIGDVLAHYLEDRFRNSNLVTATDIESIYNHARYLGYRPEGPRAARGIASFYISVPATTGSAGERIPDMRYAPTFKNVQAQNTNGVFFEAFDDVDFTKVNISSSQETRVAETLTDGTPTKFVLKRTGEVTAGKTVTMQITTGDYKAFKEVSLPEANVLEIESVIDSDGNEWFEVDYLAQEAIFEGVENFSSDKEEVPYVLKLKAVPRRFVRKTNPKTGKTSLVFGSGKATDVGKPFVPAPGDISLDLKGKLTFSTPFIDPQNFLKTKTLGLSPYNTTLTVKARTGGGKITNTARGNLNTLTSREVDISKESLDVTSLNETIGSFAISNTEPISGGEEAETPEEVKQNASALFAAQGRLATRQDYIARCLSLPSKFGKVFRANALGNHGPNGGVQIFIIAKDENDNLTTPSLNLKKNLRNYLSKFSRINQGIDILEANIINIAVDLGITVLPGLNKTKVKLEVLRELKDYFNISNWQLNQPIVLDDIRCIVKDVDGVISISSLNVFNRANTFEGRAYSSTTFGIKPNTKNGIIFCPENSIFEVKFLDSDIKVGAR